LLRKSSSSSVPTSPEEDGNEDALFERIELTSFAAIPEVSGEGQTGKGHEFAPVGTFNPTWCDLCGEVSKIHSSPQSIKYIQIMFYFIITPYSLYGVSTTPERLVAFAAATPVMSNVRNAFA